MIVVKYEKLSEKSIYTQHILKTINSMSPAIRSRMLQNVKQNCLNMRFSKFKNLSHESHGNYTQWREYKIKSCKNIEFSWRPFAAMYLLKKGSKKSERSR